MKTINRPTKVETYAKDAAAFVIEVKVYPKDVAALVLDKEDVNTLSCLLGRIGVIGQDGVADSDWVTGDAEASLVNRISQRSDEG